MQVGEAAGQKAGGVVRAPLNPGAARAKTGKAEPLNLGAARGKIENSAFLHAASRDLRAGPAPARALRDDYGTSQ